MDPLEFEDIKEIFLQFKSLHKIIHELTSKKSSIEGLSADQCYLLALIDCFDHPNQKILAERLKITPATLSVRLQRLEKAGFIEKVVSRHDKRNVTLHITEKGNKEIKSCKDDMKMFTTRLFGGINKEDLDRMKAYCQIFEKNIRLMKEELDVQD